MKLSANGIEKIHHNCRRMTYIIAGESGKPGDYTQYEGLAGAEDLEFESDDFTGAVILTAEEAKAIAYKLGYLGALTTQSKTEKETLELTDMLWWRIEQAEKGNE